MESFSPLTSIRKLLKFVAALSKYYGIAHDIVYISRLPGYLETKTTYVECDMDINKFAVRFGGWKYITIKILNMIFDFD